MAKGKKGILPKNGGELKCAPCAPCGPESSPKRFSAEEADGGFIIRESGGKLGYCDKPIVAKTIEEACERMTAYMGKGKKKEGDDA
jgi:hypothetical protein